MDEFVIKHLVTTTHTQALEFTPLQKELIFKEINFRIKDNLNTIASLFGLQLLQAQEQKNLPISKILQTNKLRVNVFSLLQELQYKQYAVQKNFYTYLVLLLDLIENEMAQKVKKVLLIEEVGLQAPQMILLGTIIAELYLNTLQHSVQDGGFEGLVKMILTKNQDQIIFDYLEEGHSDIKIEKLLHNDSIGLKLVKLHVRQLPGTLVVDTAGGLHFRILFDKLTNNI